MRPLRKTFALSTLLPTEGHSAPQNAFIFVATLIILKTPISKHFADVRELYLTTTSSSVARRAGSVPSGIPDEAQNLCLLRDALDEA